MYPKGAVQIDFWPTEPHSNEIQDFFHHGLKQLERESKLLCLHSVKDIYLKNKIEVSEQSVLLIPYAFFFSCHLSKFFFPINTYVSFDSTQLYKLICLPEITNQYFDTCTVHLYYIYRTTNKCVKLIYYITYLIIQ